MPLAYTGDVGTQAEMCTCVIAGGHHCGVHRNGAPDGYDTSGRLLLAPCRLCRQLCRFLCTSGKWSGPDPAAMLPAQDAAALPHSCQCQTLVTYKLPSDRDPTLKQRSPLSEGWTPGSEGCCPAAQALNPADETRISVCICAERTQLDTAAWPAALSGPVGMTAL